MTFQAIRVPGKGQEAQLVTLKDHDLDQGDTTVAVEYSAVNYKDGLALTDRAPILRRFPLIPGIDLAGRVISSGSGNFSAGDRVVGTGWDLGVAHDGGYAQKSRLPAAWLVRLPDRISTRQAAGIGTAGFTAMLAVLAIEHHGVTPGSGEILVTGASGGVGSLAIAILSGLGYHVVASTGKLEQSGYLKSLGAEKTIGREELSAPGKPLSAARWAGAIDSVGSHTLANVLVQARPGAAVTAVGLAQGPDLPTTVYPFILRGIVLAGINSVDTPTAARAEVWSRLARNLDLAKLETILSTVGLASVPEVAHKIVNGSIRGRVVVDVNSPR